MTREAGSKDPLHGITLENILKDLVDRYGWQQLAVWIKIDCFANEPSMSSSLRFLRRTPWARKKVENLYREIPKAGAVIIAESPRPEILKGEKPAAAAVPASPFTEIPVGIRAQVKLVPQMDRPAVQAALIHSMQKYFESLKKAGSMVFVSQISAAILAVDGVEKLETMNFYREDEGARSPHPRDLKMGRLEIPVMGKVSFLLR